MAPPKSKVDLAATVSLKALVPVNYDGTLYGPGLLNGDVFDCREIDVKQLEDVSAAERVVEVTAS